MKAILEFDLDDPAQRAQHAIMLKADELVFAIQEIDNALRSRLKYEDSISDLEVEILTRIRSHIWETLNERDVASLI